MHDTFFLLKYDKYLLDSNKLSLNDYNFKDLNETIQSINVFQTLQYNSDLFINSAYNFFILTTLLSHSSRMYSKRWPFPIFEDENIESSFFFVFITNIYVKKEMLRNMKERMTYFLANCFSSTCRCRRVFI